LIGFAMGRFRSAANYNAGRTPATYFAFPYFAFPASKPVGKLGCIANAARHSGITS